MSEIHAVPLDSVRINGGTQSRVELNQSAIAEYAEAIRFGTDLPPVVMFFDGASFWLADGFHRYHAHRQAGAMEIVADIRTGTQRDAILFSVGANASHGLRRTNEDKRKAVMILLSDPEWAAWSDNQIAKACGVSHPFVATVRAAILKPLQDSSPSTPPQPSRPVMRTVTRNGTTYEQNTANIGKAAKPDAPTEPVTPPTAEASGPIVTGALSGTTKPAEAKLVDSGLLEQNATLTEDRAELTELIETLQANLKETLADNEMMGRVFDADDRLKAAMDEAKRQKAIAENAERTLAAKSGEFIERARAVTYWKNRAEKAEKRLATLEKST